MAAAAPPPSASPSMKDAGNAAYKAGDYSQAEQLYSQAIASDPPSASLLANRAAARVMLGRFADAVKDCEAAVALDPSFEKAYVRAGKALLSLGEFERSQAMYTQALLRDPRNATALEERRLAELTAARVARARDALAAGDARRAAALLAPAAEAAPASADVALLRAEAALATGDLDAAQSVTATVLARFGPSTRVLVLRARVLHRQGNTASAIRHLQEGLRHDPDSAELAAALRPLKRLETRREEGNAAFAAGRWVDAERAYSDALAADATSAAGTAKLLANRAAARLKLRQWAAAVDDCTACLELDASFVKALMRRATALRELGGAENLERAMRDLEAAKRSVDDGDSLRSLEADLRQVKRDLKAAKRKDYYAILGVARDADEDAVRKAYRKAALQWHPDRHSSEPEEQRKRAEAMFKDVGEAYTVLSDADKRRRYDLGGGEDGFDDDDDGHGHGHGGMRMSEMDLFNMLFSGMHSAPGRGRGGGGGGGGGFHFSF